MSYSHVITLQDGVDKEGSPKEKRYRIRRMFVLEGDKWAQDVIYAINKATSQFSIDMMNSEVNFGEFGLLNLLKMVTVQSKIYGDNPLSNFIINKITPEERQPIFDKLYSLIEVFDGKNWVKLKLDTGGDVIYNHLEDPNTLISLREEALRFHSNFILAEGRSVSRETQLIGGLLEKFKPQASQTSSTTSGSSSEQEGQA